MLRDIGRDPNSQITFEDFTKIMTAKMGDRNSREEIGKVLKFESEFMVHVKGDVFPKILLL